MDEPTSFLMEKLRAKGGTYKSFKEYAKSLRMTLLEKRYALEISEKNYLQECLDLLQQNILVSTIPAVVERLEVISRHLGLKFVSGSSRLEWFISSDMFYVEVVLEPNGHIKDVKIHHDGTGERQSCEELKTTLEKRDFKDFTLQLEGLISIYNLNADQKIKSKAFSSLQYLEADIMQLFDLQCSFLNDPFDIIYKSDVGFVQKRRGGHPMKIIYFVSPYDLLDVSKKTCKPLSLDLPEVDYSVSLCLESSSTNKLQTQNLVKVIKSEKFDENSDLQKPTPLYEELTPANTSLLPACFMMKLKERMPICESLIEEMRHITDIDLNKGEGPHPVLSLIKREIHKKHIECDDDSSIVTLPDQRHCYIMTNNSDLQAYIVQSIPFSHPSHISKILPLLRRQALFNSFIASCIRPKTAEDDCDKLNQNFSEVMHCDTDYVNGFGLKLFGSEDFKSLSIFNESPQKSNSTHITMFEVMPLSLEQITVSFEHPVDETLITVELDLSDVSNLRCNISVASEDTNINMANAQESTGRALQRSFSIPATMRVLIRLWDSQTDSSDEEDFNGSGTNNDVADLGEVADSQMETESGKENGDCTAVDFGSSVGVKLETSDSCENSLDGFPSLVSRSDDFDADTVFVAANNNSSALRYPTFDAEMMPVGTTPTTSANLASTSSFDRSSPFLDNTNEQPMFELKSKSMDLMENLAFFNAGNCSHTKSDMFVAEGHSQQQQQRADCEIVIDSSSDSEQSEHHKDAATSLIADAKDPSPGSNSSLEFSALTEPLPDAEKAGTCPDFNIEVNNLDDVPLFVKLTDVSKTTTLSSKNADANAIAAALIPELEGKTLMSPSISITPVTLPTVVNAQSKSGPNNSSPNVHSLLNSICLDRRPGIDVSLTPFSASAAGSSSSALPSSSPSITATPTLPASLTITPIVKDDDRVPKDRASGSKSQKVKSGDDKARLEKKKKRKHDDSGPMGPPEKIPAKAEQLCRPVSVSLRPADIVPRSLSPSGVTPRKYTVSPTQSSPMSFMGKVSPNNSAIGSSNCGSGNNSGNTATTATNNNNNNNNNNNVQSCKSSNVSSAPSSLGGSPKMASTNVSPKHSVTSSSPKNVSSGSSGKPSMSALKQVVTSPSSVGKSGGAGNSGNNNELKSKLSHKDSTGREYKEKKNSSYGGSGSGPNSGHQSPKPKSSSSSAKFSKSDANSAGALMSPQYDAALMGGSSACFEAKFAVASSAKTKKGGLMAVVDRLNLNQISKSEDGCGNGGVKVAAGNGGGSSVASGSTPLKDAAKIGSVGAAAIDAKGQSATTKGSNEYMIKHHNDGIKVTINRTRATRDSLTSGKSSSAKDSGAPGNDSPKHKTNISGGGSSSSGGGSGGVASALLKRFGSTSKPSLVSGTSSTNKTSSGGTSKHSSKSSSSSSSSIYKSKSNHSTKSHSAESGGRAKEKVRPPKTHSATSASSTSSTSSSSAPSASSTSDKSIFASLPKRSSPSTQIELAADGGADKQQQQYKAPYQPINVFPKNLANYQIPKISDRNKVPDDSAKKLAAIDGSTPSDAGGGGVVVVVAKDGKTNAVSCAAGGVSDSTGSPLKPLAFAGTPEERGILTEAAKNTNTYDASNKPKQQQLPSQQQLQQTGAGNENSLESVSGGGVTSQHQMAANCSMASVQSATDSLKLNLAAKFHSRYEVIGRPTEFEYSACGE